MNAFERGLSRRIPLEKAAGFFLGLKSHARPNQSEVALMKRAAALCKVAADEESVEGSHMTAPTPADVPQQQQYLSNELQGMQAEEQASVEYYRQLLEQMRGETSQAQERATQ